MIMLDIHRLEIFAKVAELKSFSKAAKKMFLTQPTVSQHITSLEDFLGIVLFDRLGKEIALTRAGEILYKYAKEITLLTAEARQALDHFKGKKYGHLVLSASTIPGEYILPGLLGKFKIIYPGIRVTLKIGDTEDVVNDVLNAGVELGIVGAKLANQHLQYSRFLDDELILVVPPEHHWWEKTFIEVQDLIKEPFIMREHGSGTRICLEHRLQSIGVSTDKLRIIAEVGSTTAVKQAIKSNLGISLISERAVQEEIQHKTLKKIPIRHVQFTRSFFVVRHKKRTPSPLCKALSTFLSSLK